MRLTQGLSKYFPSYKVGKMPYRCRRKNNPQIKKITIEELKRKRFDFEIEERNMLLLRHPYLTVEQSYGHMTEENALRIKNFMDSMKQIKEDKFSKKISIMDRFQCLLRSEAWD